LLNRYYGLVRQFFLRQGAANLEELLLRTFERLLEGPPRPWGRSTQVHVLAVASDVCRQGMVTRSADPDQPPGKRYVTPEQRRSLLGRALENADAERRK
jgi:hypothetical protein